MARIDGVSEALTGAVGGTVSSGRAFGGRLGARLAPSVTPLFRRGILAATHNRAVAAGVRRHGMRFGAARFVAGETLDACIPVLRGLNADGLVTNTTLLGEGVRDEARASEVADAYVEILDRIAAEGVRTNVALKLTHLGLDLGEEVAAGLLERVVVHARGRDNFVRVDMEESERVTSTLRICQQLWAEGHENVGTVLQSALFRTERDLDQLLPLRPNLRLVKGAYLESPTVAYANKVDVDRNYVRLAERMLVGEGFTAIATHDDRIIEHLIGFAARRGVGTDRFEFQMLYGIRSAFQRELAGRGFRVRVATPFGPDWYFYLMRRLAERPANAAFLLRSLRQR